MVSKYLQKALRQILSQTDTLWPSINSRTAKSSLLAVRTTEAITHQTKHMSSFYMLPKGCTSIFRSFRRRLTRLWCSEIKSSLPAAKTSDATTHQVKHMSSFYMLPKGCSSNFKSFWQHLTRFWCSEAKSSLPATKLPRTMESKLELMDHLKMTPIGSLSNFRSIGYRSLQSLKLN